MSFEQTEIAEVEMILVAVGGNERVSYWRPTIRAHWSIRASGGLSCRTTVCVRHEVVSYGSLVSTAHGTSKTNLLGIAPISTVSYVVDCCEMDVFPEGIQCCYP